MNARVFYHSATGNTARVGKAIAEAAGCAADPIAGSAAGLEADVLFIGGAVYATAGHGLAPELKRFIASLDPKKVLAAAVFSTGFKQSGACGIIAGLLRARGVRVVNESFFCKGRFLLVMAGHPNAADLQEAKDFALRVIGRKAP